MTCPSCAAASTNWASGSFRAGCKGCEIRSTALAPQHLRQQAYAAISASHGVAEAIARRDAVKAEFARIQALMNAERESARRA